METPEQRSLRREASAWLTKQINSRDFDHQLGGAIRGAVIQGLASLDARLKAVNQDLCATHHIKDGRPLVRFYMKGGNAFECIKNRNGDEARRLGGGTSDWDTQIVIDPWAPIPIQNKIYGMVEDIVLDEFRKVGSAIAVLETTYATAAGPGLDFIAALQALWGAPPPPGFKNPNNYALTYDDPQTIRRIYDRDMLGLWTDTRQKLSDKKIANPEWMPGMTYNDAIKPFNLYRLGYTWHMESPVAGDLQIVKPLLMELIDVTIPRRNTIEAVGVWEELAQNHIEVSDVDVCVEYMYPPGIHAVLTPCAAVLPLPDIYYHLKEILTMMCEVADGTSHHVDKIIKRFQRFNVIWNGNDHGRIIEMINSHVGVVDITAEPPPPCAGAVYAALFLYATGAGPVELGRFSFNDTVHTLPSYLIGWKMMRYVETHSKPAVAPYENGAPTAATIQRFHAAWASLVNSFYIRLLSRSFNDAGIAVQLSGACSNDLALIDFVLENGYMDIRHIPLSGVDQAVVIRVSNYDNLVMISGRFLSLFDEYVKADPLHAVYSIKSKTYNTTRTNGLTYECLFVVFLRNKALAYITLTTATPADVPFQAGPVNDADKYCPVSEVARQRKVAAALIEDYIIRTALSQQYDVLRDIILLN